MSSMIITADGKRTGRLHRDPANRPARPIRAVGVEGDGLGELLARYGCGPVKFTGTDDALYERRLVFDHVINPGGGRAARAVRGRGRRHARRALPAMGPDRAGVRPGQSQAGLLPLDGVPDRTVAGEQHHQPDALARGRLRRQGQGLEARRDSRARARRRPRQRRARPARGVLHRIHGHDGHTGRRIRPPLRLRDLPPGDPRRLPGRTARPLAQSAGPVGSAAPERDGGGAARLPVRGARGRDLGAPRAALAPAGRALRPAGGRLRGRTINTLRLWQAATPDVFDFGEFSGGDFFGACRTGSSRRRSVASSTRTTRRPGAVAALHPGVLPGRLLPGRHRRPVPPPRE